MIESDLKQQADSHGIFVGVFSGKNARIFEVDDVIAAFANHAHVYQQFRCCVFAERQETVKSNETVVLSDGDMEDLVGQVLELIYLQDGEKLFRVKMFSIENISLEGNLSHHKIVRSTEVERVIRTCQFKRKVVLLKIDNIRHIIVDYNRQCLDVEVLVPVYPSINDMVVLKDDMHSLVQINEISVENKHCAITYFTETHNVDVFEPNGQGFCYWDDIASLVQGEEIDGCFIRH